MTTYNPAIHHRRSIRLKGYDYAQEGLYFITICCKDRLHLFGEIKNGKMILNEFGEKAEECWKEIPNHFPNVALHEYVIMPNHVHGIIEIKFNSKKIEKNLPIESNLNDISKPVGANDFLKPVGANNHSPLRVLKNSNQRDLPHSPSKTIGSIIRGYKIGVTKWIRQNSSIREIWQRNYYDHIIQNESSLLRISNYIQNNPKNWKEDKFYL